MTWSMNVRTEFRFSAVNPFYGRKPRFSDFLVCSKTNRRGLFPHKRETRGEEALRHMKNGKGPCSGQMKKISLRT